MKDDFKRASRREVSHDGVKGDFRSGDDRQRHRRRIRARLKRDTSALIAEETKGEWRTSHDHNQDSEEEQGQAAVPCSSAHGCLPRPEEGSKQAGLPRA